MCGIFVSTRVTAPNDTSGYNEETFENLCLHLEERNAARGPDAQNKHTVVIPLSPNFSGSSNDVSQANNSLAVTFYASELRLRGESPIIQPHARNGNVLCWNGEVFEGIEISAQENDGSKIFDLLCTLDTPEQIRDLFSRIEGPYAFAFYHGSSQRLFFARDPLGRRSLLIHKPTRELPFFLLSSVSAGPDSAYNFTELPTDNIFSIDFKYLSAIHEGTILDCFYTALNPICRTPEMPDNACRFAEPGKVNTSIPPDNLPCVESLDRIPEHLQEAVNNLVRNLERSVSLRVSDIPSSRDRQGKARLAVLFSGGIDSTILAYMAHKYIPLNEPIDLLNVGFENPRKIRIQNQGNVGGLPKRNRKGKPPRTVNIVNDKYAAYMVPDRVTGLAELEELRRLCPGRVWNFVEVDVPYLECQAARCSVEALMAPGRTVMDLSLALALYFASRGQGQVRKTPQSNPEPYHSDARVILSGLGSDELLGGYGRHRTVYMSGGWKAVIEELQQEIDRIPTRNLGRDDRVISSHGKETRHPFLSLTLVSFLASLPVHMKMDPRVETGLGDKMLLRLAAYKVGLVEASIRKKRAMQFGSHSARMDGERRGDVELEVV
ncbi:asparagine synthase-domain-containing protein [Crassisporium funariophilum]|nr:asparagine synthase-domain-containing protein [Crassisporium funariophilum]